MTIRHAPFDASISDLEPKDLVTLRGVSEGWYVEYKSQLIDVKRLAKSMSGFANQYGGWLFLGIQENPWTTTAKSFPGLESTELVRVKESLRNASRAVVNPEVFFEERIFEGPIDEIELPAERIIVAVRVPQGAESPYVHNDGRIYRRVGDSSDPKPETDRAILDRMWERSDRARSRLSSLISYRPPTSKGEENVCYIHVFLTSDPHEIKGHLFRRTFADFVHVMKEPQILFDNFYTNARGFVARQAANNNPYHRVLTWEFDRKCHSFVTVPLSHYLAGIGIGPADYEEASEFDELLKEYGMDASRVVDLNMMFDAVGAIAKRHRSLAAKAGIYGPFHCKVSLENVWRVVPFLAMPSFAQHIRDHGVPVVQESDTFTPPGVELSTFIQLPEAREKEDRYVDDAIKVSLPLFKRLASHKNSSLKNQRSGYWSAKNTETLANRTFRKH
ncbi:MAG: ATP-binding protein [Dehalococcoidia bacterium]